MAYALHSNGSGSRAAVACALLLGAGFVSGCATTYTESELATRLRAAEQAARRETAEAAAAEHARDVQRIEARAAQRVAAGEAAARKALRDAERDHAATRTRLSDELRRAETDFAQQLALQRREAAAALADQERKSVEALRVAVRQGEQAGFEAGASATAKRLSEAEEEEAESAQRRALKALADFEERFGKKLLLGGRQVREDRVQEMQYRHLMDQVQSQLDQAGYVLTLAVPQSVVGRMREYGERPLTQSFSPAFNADFADHFEKFTVLDGLALLLRVHGLELWVGHDGRTVWLAPPERAPVGQAGSRVDVYFDQSKFMGRVPMRAPGGIDYGSK